MSNLKGQLEKVIEEVSSDEVRGALERIIERRPRKRAAKKPRSAAESLLDEINFDRRLRAHPLVGKTINQGNLARSIKKSDHYRKLNEKLNEVLKRGSKVEDVIEIKNILDGLRSKAIDYIVEVEVSRAEQGLRRIHSPGSVAKSEGRNLYFPGEKYTEETLRWLASRVCSSITLGDSLGIYSENENLMSELEQLAVQMFKSTFKIEPEELEISRDEANCPYASLLALVLWLAKELRTEEAEVKALAQSILSNLRTSVVTLFFMPPEKERWSTIGLPRLDVFIDRWILNEESRKKVEALRDELKRFITAVRKVAGMEAENAVDLLMSNYEALCRRLIEHGSLDFYAARRLVDVMVNLAAKYDLRMYLRPLGQL
jgi:hypothetical protein